MPLDAESRQFAADRKALPDVVAFAAAASAEAGFDGVARLFVELIIEELFTNSIVHGYGADSDQPVWVSLAREGDNLSLIYEDAAPPCNPLTLPAPAMNLPVEERPVGGLGMPLVKALAHSTLYARDNGRNRVTLLISPRVGR